MRISVKTLLCSVLDLCEPKDNSKNIETIVGPKVHITIPAWDAHEVRRGSMQDNVCSSHPDYV